MLLVITANLRDVTVTQTLVSPLSAEDWMSLAVKRFHLDSTLLNEVIGFCENLGSSACQTESNTVTLHARFN